MAAKNSPPTNALSTSKTRTSAGFNLRQLIHEVRDESDLTDPADIAVEVLPRIPAKHRQAVLAQLLPGYVADVVRAIRNGYAVTPKANPSAKVKGIREDWRRRLRDDFFVGGEWKARKDLTYDDLMAIAADRRQLAADNIAAAERAEKEAAAIKEYGVATFGDLPEDVQQELLEGSA